MQTYDSRRIYWLSGIYGGYDDILLHTLPMVFYPSERAPLSISYSSLLFKPPCIPSYLSSFRIELRTSPLLIPIVSLRVLLCSNPSSYSYQFLCHRPRYDTQEIRQIPKTYNSDLFLQPWIGAVFNSIRKLQLSSIVHYGITQH